MARPSAVIYLLGATITQDDIRNQIPTVTEREVFAEELAVFANDFYGAAATGLRPERVFEVYTREYRGETQLKHQGVTYGIIRTTLGKTSERTRLTCERVKTSG
jgi:hypothetical protein